MKQKFQTAERVSQKDISDNYVFQRSVLAYVEAAKLIFGDVLEIGTGSGYGIEILSEQATSFVTVDKFPSKVGVEEADNRTNVAFKQMNDCTKRSDLG